MSTLKKTAFRSEACAPTTTRVVSKDQTPPDEGYSIVETKERKTEDEVTTDVLSKMRLFRAIKGVRKDGQLNNVYFALFFNQAYTTSAYLASVLAINPASTSDWSYITALYDDFRIRKVSFEVYLSATMTPGNILGMAYDRDAVPSSAGITMTSLVQYENHKIFNPGVDGHLFTYTHKITTPVTSAPSLTALPITINDWQPVNSASAFYYGGVYFSSSLASATNVNIPVVIKYWVDLRVRH